MKIIVSGGRDFTDRDFVFQHLDRLGVITCVVHGAARGVDTIADQWAQIRGVERRPYPIRPEDWKIYGKRAGRRRNEMMLQGEKVGLYAVVIFPGGNGTAHMKEISEREGMRVVGLGCARNGGEVDEPIAYR